jgi:nucleoside-diphosphate-sugar epimerase
LDSGIPFHYIIHAASYGSPNFFVNTPVEVMKSNLFGVANLMEYGLNHGMKRFLYVSTGEVYGQNEAELLDEKSYGYVDILNTRSCYPSSKRAAETLAMCYAVENGADVVVARPCHTYGPHFTESDNRVYAQFIRNVLNGEDIVLKSAGTQYRSWCYVEDCVSALMYILLKGENGQAYNIADKNSEVTIRELAEMIARIAGRKVVMQVASESEKKEFTPIKHAVFDTSKLETLGWQVSGTMEEKLRRTIELLV